MRKRIFGRFGAAPANACPAAAPRNSLRLTVMFTSQNIMRAG
jgi:hypothetical protein